MTKDEVKQQKKNEALNKIIFTHSKYFNYEQGNPWGDWDDLPSSAEQRDKEVKRILENLENELKKLKI